MFFGTFDASLSHIAVLGNALPRRCGLATYTSHSVAALREAFPGLTVDHYAMDDGQGVAYGPDVAMTITADDVSAYIRAAAAIRRSGAQLLWVHHEFGIFGGPAGSHLLALLKHLDLPVVVTLHTLLSHPDPDQARVMQGLLAASDRLIVMAREGERMLADLYRVDPRIVRVIPHGAPDRPLRDSARLKAKLGLGDGPIVLTFGLLSPGKGIETAIQALPPVVARQPGLRYLIVGATHPALVRDQGETYRESLIALAARLGMEEHVQFVDRFLEDDALLDYLQAADVYLTPYPGEEQITSGTLAYALALGRPVVSTPYVHAREALADGIGTLVPFSDAAAISATLVELLDDPDRLAGQARRIWRAARPTIWARNARAVMDVMNDAKTSRPVALPDQRRTEPFLVRLDGIAAMTDGVGIIQHSVHGVPDRRHGYCIDDNARALILVNCLGGEVTPEWEYRAVRFAAFIQHAWNPDEGAFRNFMSYDRRWLEDRGSDDSNGRAIWALGHCAAHARSNELARWAREWFDGSARAVAEVRSPRTIAFAMLGAAEVLGRFPADATASEILGCGAAFLEQLRGQMARPDWDWFEPTLAYDNARLPEALLRAGSLLKVAAWQEAGLETLGWLCEQQTAATGCFRPVGSEGFGRPHDLLPFDQQPLEAWATIAACGRALAVSHDERWRRYAEAAWYWFFGANDRGEALASIDTGRCHDGLTPRGINRNVGAESTLAFHLAYHAMDALIWPRGARKDVGFVHADMQT